MIGLIGFFIISIISVITFTFEHFISQLLIGSIIIIFLHELGHLLTVILLNRTEDREWQDFRIKITANSIEVQHPRFKSRIKNIIVASAGVFFPIIVCFSIYILFDGPIIGLLVFLSILNFAFILPCFPDGKNILLNLETEE
ncbi:hypothetical protein [Alkalihalobacterium bogoriense]|uniref:hypothetical protein n=1 Tax=Alkalihalobacterium bogoriense TaxID=246272 RepID=UPI00047992A2|nr:hypothetical protein [Alkalihalobacterium bogoriense]